MIPEEGWNQTGPRAFIRDLVLDLARGDSRVVLVQESFPIETLANKLTDALTAANVTAQWAQLGTGRPLEELSKAFHAQGQTIPQLAESLAAQAFVTLVACLPAAANETWSLFAIEWVRHRERAPGGSMPALCIISQRDIVLPPGSPNLVWWWWGRTSALDAQAMVRERDANPNPQGRWREHLIRSVAAGDLALVERLADDWRGANPTGLKQALSRVCPAVGEDPPRISRKTLVPPIGLAPEPEHSLNWAAGLVYATPEYGVEWHPSRLQSGPRGQVELDYRLWRGQNEFLDAALDAFRIDLCQRLTDSHGRDWPEKFGPPEDSRERERAQRDPTCVGWGLLDIIANKGRSATIAPLAQRIRKCRNLRNDLSHQQVILWEQVSSVVNG